MQLKRLGVLPTVVFLGSHSPLSRLLEHGRIQFECLDFPRGSGVLLQPKTFARVVSAHGPDGVILDSIGYAPIALRTSGYRERVVSVEHGSLIERGLSPRKRLVRAITRVGGAWATDIEVAVSDFLLRTLARRTHARQLVRIHNGVDLDEYKPRALPSRDVFTIGWAGRMVWGKGVFELLAATAAVAKETPVQLVLAGDGPDRAAIRRSVERLDLEQDVIFTGTVLDMSSFWAQCDAAAFPTNGLIESFGLAAVEAMACGKPVVASRSGGLAEVVEDGRTGILVEPGDVQRIAAALRRYAHDESLRAEHGRQARADCERRFDIKIAARRYLALFER